MANSKQRPGARVEVVAPLGKAWLRATVISEDRIKIDMDADPVWGGCELTRSQWRRIRTISDDMDMDVDDGN